MTAAHGRPKPGDSLYRVISRRGWIFFPPQSTIIGERWYRFKRGRGFVVLPADLAKRAGYKIEYVRPATAEDIEYLESNLGSDWSWLHNCVTVMSRPLNDRWAIAIRCAAICLAVLLVCFAFNAYVDRKIEAARDLISEACR